MAPTPEESVWLAVDLGQSMTLNRVVIYEFQHRMTQYQIEYSDGENDWKVAKAVTGETYDETNPYEITLDFAEVEAQYVRLNILEAKNGEEDLTPSIFEMQIFHIQEEPVPENGNLAYHKTGNTNSSYTSGAYGPELAFDGEKEKNSPSRWSAATTIPEGESIWLSVDLGEKMYFNQVVITEFGQRMTDYQLEYSNDGSIWNIAYKVEDGPYSGANPNLLTIDLPLIEAQHVRINIFQAKTKEGNPEKPCIYEMEIFNTQPEAAAVQQAVKQELEQSISGEPLNQITTDVTLQSTVMGKEPVYEGSVTWTSTHPEVIDPETGKVTRPNVNTVVTLTATVNITTEPTMSFAIPFALTVLQEQGSGGEEKENLALNKTASTNSAYSNGSYGPELAFDGNKDREGTRWSATSSIPDKGESIWLCVDLGETVSFDQVVIYEFQHRMKDYAIEYSNNGTTWETAKMVTGDTFSSERPYEFTLDLPLIEAQYVRVNIFAAQDASGNDVSPTIYEMEVYYAHPEGAAIKTAVQAELEQQISKEPLNQITADVTLPETVSGTQPAYTGSVTWASTLPEVIDPATGKVTRKGSDTVVTLTATVRITGETEFVFEIPFSLTVLKVEVPGIDSDKNLALHQKGSTNSAYSSGGYGANLAFDGEKEKNGSSRWSAAKTIPETGESIWLSVDLGEKTYFDQVIVYEMQHRMTSYQIEYSDDGAIWQVAKKVTGDAFSSANPYELVLDLPLIEARYVRINIFEAKTKEGKDEKPSIYEMEVYLTENHLEEYVQNMLVQDLARQITMEDSGHVTLDFYLPEEIISSVTGDTAHISWNAQPSGIVDTDTGKLKRADIDTQVRLTAQVQMNLVGTFSQDFDYVVQAAEPERELMEAQSFAGIAALPEGYELSLGQTEDVALEQNRITLYKSGPTNSMITGDLSIGSGFYAAGFVPFEVTVSSQEATDSRFVLKSGKDEMGGIAFMNGQYTAFVGDIANTFPYTEEKPLQLLFNFDAAEHYLYLYAIDSAGQRQFLAAGPVKEKIAFADGLEIANRGSGGISLYSANTYMESAALLDVIQQQFTFDKICAEPIDAVNNDLVLFTSIGSNVSVKWKSSHPEIVSETGKVSVSQGEQAVSVTADVTYGQQSFSKTFLFTVGVMKLSDGKTVTSTARPEGGSSLSNMLDSNKETVYRTTGYETEFSILVDLKEKSPFNSLRIDEVGGDGKILQYSVEVSSDQKEWRTVQTGNTVGENARITFELCNERYVRFQVLKKEEGAVGIAELGVYLQSSPEEIIDYAFRQIVVPDELANGVQLPLTGALGTEIAWSTDSPYVSISADGKVSITAGNTSQAVNLYADVTYKDVVVRKETKSVIIGTGTGQRPTRPSGGGGGGGGGSLVGNVGTGEIQTGPTEEPSPEEPEYQFAEELNGHWAQTEITSLVQQGIVRGDESGLHLQEPITRAEFMALLIRSLGITPLAYEGGFEDVDGSDWYADTIQAAVAAGIAQGDGGKMFPNATITREEMTKMLAAACEDKRTSAQQTMQQFIDDGQISSWAKEAVDTVAALGIINGFEDGSFRPQEYSLREQAMAVIYRLLHLETE